MRSSGWCATPSPWLRGRRGLRWRSCRDREHLTGGAPVHVEDVQRVLARGGEAYGFSFTVADEVRGRVAVVRAGDYVALAVASWPMGAPPEVVDDVDAMIGSLGPVPGPLPPGVF